MRRALWSGLAIGRLEREWRRADHLDVTAVRQQRAELDLDPGGELRQWNVLVHAADFFPEPGLRVTLAGVHGKEQRVPGVPRARAPVDAERDRRRRRRHAEEVSFPKVRTQAVLVTDHVEIGSCGSPLLDDGVGRLDDRLAVAVAVLVASPQLELAGRRAADLDVADDA